MDESELGRRTLLRTCAVAACTPALAQVGCARRIDVAPRVFVGPAIDGKLVLSVAQARPLTGVGGALVVTSEGGPSVLVANATDDLIALEATCPHQGCLLTWVPEDLQAECPCHGSRFASDGTLLSPPAKSDVRAWAVARDPGTHEVSVDLGRVLGPPQVFGAIDANGELSVALRDHPELSIEGGSVIGEPPGLGHTLVVVRAGPGEVRAFDATCSHLQCTVEHIPRFRRMECPCHGSRYDESGAVTKGPATRSLRSFPVTFDGGIARVKVR